MPKTATVEVETTQVDVAPTAELHIVTEPMAPPPIRAKQLETRKMRIAGDAVTVATKDLPENQRDAIRWIHSYAWRQDMSLKEVATAVGYDHTTWHRVFNGDYEGSLANVTEAILKFRKLSAERSTVAPGGFIMTSAAQKIFNACDGALIFQKVMPIIGEGAGISTTLEEYARRNAGHCTYVRMGTGGVLWDLMQELAEQKNLPTSLAERQLRRRIIKSFSGKNLLIVDDCEAGFCALGTGMSPVRAIEFLREIHDRTKCGLVLAGDDLFRDGLQRGKWSHLLGKMRRRIVATVVLKTRPTRSDLEALARQMQLGDITDEALGVQEEVTKDGLGKWVTLLSTGSRLAAKDRQDSETVLANPQQYTSAQVDKARMNKNVAFNWSHVVKAHAMLLKLDTTLT